MSRRMDKEEAAHLQYETEHTEPSKSRSVLVYMVILIAAAFLLLLLAYFMQLRTAENVEGLHQTVDSFQTIDQLADDNHALQEEVARLKEENAALESKLVETEDSLREATVRANEYQSVALDAENRAKALNALHQLRVLYNSGQYKAAKALLEGYPEMGDILNGVNHTLSEEELDIYDPLAAYQRIAKLLGVD